VKRPILAFLAAVILNVGVVGTAPARAAAPDSVTAATPAHEHGHRHDYRDRDGDYYDGGHRHHPRHYGDDDGDGYGYGDGYGDGGHRRRCSGLIVVCLV
jgi:hypothetical protein